MRTSRTGRALVAAAGAAAPRASRVAPARASAQSIGSGRWAQVRPAKASTEIVAQIRDKLFRQTLKPGAFIGSERALCAQFGVARLTMRDALRILEASGIVEVKVGKGGGVRVAQPNPERFADALAIQLALAGVTRREIFDAQLGVEARAAAIAATAATAADFEALDAQLARVRAARAKKIDFVRESQEFHMGVVRAAHNRVLEAQFEALRHLAWRSILADHSLRRARNVIARHERLLAALKARDAEAAGGVVHEHVRAILALAGEA